MSKALLEQGYQAIDTKRRDHRGRRIFKLLDPDGEKVAIYGAMTMEQVIPEMQREIAKREGSLDRDTEAH